VRAVEPSRTGTSSLLIRPEVVSVLELTVLSVRHRRDALSGQVRTTNRRVEMSPQHGLGGLPRTL
jgi:hypothetical protein